MDSQEPWGPRSSSAPWPRGCARGGRSEIFSHGGARREAERLGTEFLGEAPLDLRIRETSDAGTPITVSEPDNPVRARLPHMAARIWEKIARVDAERRPPPRIVIE